MRVACVLSAVDEAERLIRYVPNGALAANGYVTSGGMSPPDIGVKLTPVYRVLLAAGPLTQR